MVRKLGLVLCVLIWGSLASACSQALPFLATPTLTPTSTSTATATPTSTLTPTITPTFTQTPTATDTPTMTLTPSITPTPSMTPTPTFDFPDITVNQQAHCRYGPGTAYLHAADLYTGDHGLLWNRNYSATWLWVRFDKLNYACWVAASVVTVEGNVKSVTVTTTRLPHSTLYGPPHNVDAKRSGSDVIVTWDAVWMTEDDFRGYMIEARVCQHGVLIDTAVHTDGTSITLDDDTDCTSSSSGKLYAVEKHGYTDPVKIDWP